MAITFPAKLGEYLSALSNTCANVKNQIRFLDDSRIETLLRSVSLIMPKSKVVDFVIKA